MIEPALLSFFAQPIRTNFRQILFFQFIAQESSRKTSGVASSAFGSVLLNARRRPPPDVFVRWLKDQS